MNSLAAVLILLTADPSSPFIPQPGEPAPPFGLAFAQSVSFEQGVRQPRAGARPNSAERYVRYDVGSFDVAGVKLGMSPQEVRAILQARGFALTEKKALRSFAKDVEWAAKRRNQQVPAVAEISGPASIVGRDPLRNSITVFFTHMRRGPVVSKIILTFDSASNDVARLERDVVARYGAASQTFIGSLGSHWCDTRDTGRCEPGYNASAPRLEYTPAPFFTLELTDQAGADVRRNAEIAALLGTPDGERQRGLLGT